MSDFQTQHITLRGGKRADEHGRPVADGPHVCPKCSGELVYPVSWDERIGSCWRLVLRCPDCEWRGEGEFDQLDVEAFDDVLNNGTADLLATLRSLSRANMQADVERLVRAIESGQIQPMDF